MRTALSVHKVQQQVHQLMVYNSLVSILQFSQSCHSDLVTLPFRNFATLPICHFFIVSLCRFGIFSHSHIAGEPHDFHGPIHEERRPTPLCGTLDEWAWQVFKHRFVGMQICDYVALWLRVYVAMWLCGRNFPWCASLKEHNGDKVDRLGNHENDCSKSVIKRNHCYPYIIISWWSMDYLWKILVSPWKSHMDDLCMMFLSFPDFPNEQLPSF